MNGKPWGIRASSIVIGILLITGFAWAMTARDGYAFPPIPYDPADLNRVSRATGVDGVGGDCASYVDSMSYDGSIIAFDSDSTNFVTGIADNSYTDGNGDVVHPSDVFVRDTVNNTTELISVNLDGNAAGDDASYGGFLSADGRYVAFTSKASDLVANDDNNQMDAFLRDRTNATTTLLSLAADGVTQGDSDSYPSGISPDGRYVLFSSDATNLVAGDNNGVRDLFVYDTQATGAPDSPKVRLVSLDPDESQFTYGSTMGAIGGGVGEYYVVFEVYDTDNQMSKYYKRDIVANTTTEITDEDTYLNDPAWPWVSDDGSYSVSGVNFSALTLTYLADYGVEQDVSGLDAFMPVISGDGRHIAFDSELPLVADDGNDTSDLFQIANPLLVRLDVTIDPPDSGSVETDPPSVDGMFQKGSTVKLTAVPATDRYFDGWSDGAQPELRNPRTITMDGDRQVAASFTDDPNIPPQTTITKPLQDAILSGDTADKYDITGTSIDAASGIKKVEIAVMKGSASPQPSDWYVVTGGTTDEGGAYSWTYHWPGTTPPQPEGKYTIYARATDTGDNAESPLPSVRAAVDNNPPSSTIGSGWALDVKLTNLTVTGAASDSGAGVNYVDVAIVSGAATPVWKRAIDSSGNGSWSAWSYTTPVPAAGVYTIKTRATDKAGKAETPAAGKDILVEKSPPATTITAPAQGLVMTGAKAFVITGSATDTGVLVAGVQKISGVKKVELSINGGAWFAVAGAVASWSYTWAKPVEGRVTIQSRATDCAGNVETPKAAVSVVYDATAPASAITSPSDADGCSLGGAAYTILGTADDALDAYGIPGTGVKLVEVKIDKSATNITTGVETITPGAWAPATYCANGTDFWIYNWNISTLTASTATTDVYYTIYVRSTDKAGNVESLDMAPSAYVTINKKLPSSTITAPVNGLLVNTSTLAINGTAAPGSSTLKQVDVQVVDEGGNAVYTRTITGTAAANWSATWTLPASLNDAPDGDYTITSTAYNNNTVPDPVSFETNDTQTTPARVAVVVDRTGPDSTITDPVEGATSRTPAITVKGTADDFGGTGVAKVEFSSDDGATWALATLTGFDPSAGGTQWSYSWTVPADGNYTLRCRGTDRLGNVQMPATIGAVRVAVDKTPPPATITAPSAGGKIKGASYTIRGTAGDGAGSGVVKVEVSMMPGATAPSEAAWRVVSGTNTWSYNWSPLPSDGSYTIRARATDQFGNKTALATGTAVTVDKAAPVSAITDPSNGANINGVSYLLKGTVADTNGSGVNKVEVGVSTDGGNIYAWKTAALVGTPAASWQYAWSLPADGDALLMVRATDNAGNVGTPGAPLTAHMKIPPPAIITYPADGASIKGVSCTLTGTAGDGSADGTSVQKVEAAVTLSTATAPLSTDWKPATTMSAAVGGNVTWTYTWTLPADGSYKVWARATDAGGGAVAGTPASRSVRVDKIGPSGTITSPAANAVIKGSIVVTGSAADTGSGVKNVMVSAVPVGVADNFQPATATTANWATWSCTARPADGSCSVKARVTDNADNTFTTAAVTVKYDKTPPVTVITEPAQGIGVKGTSCTIKCTATDPVSGVDKVFAAVLSAGTNPTASDWKTTTLTTGVWSYTWTAGAEGRYVIWIRALDKLGNEGIISRALAVDRTVPTGAVTKPASNTGVRAVCPIEGTASDPLAGVKSVEVVVSPSSVTTPPTTGWAFAADASGNGSFSKWSWGGWALPATDGNYLVRIRVTDKAGNQYVGAAGSTVCVDRASPVSAITAPATTGLIVTNGLPYTITGTSGDGTTGSGIQGVEVSITGGVYDGSYVPATTFVAATGAWTYALNPLPADGGYDIRARAADKAGNVQSGSTIETGRKTLVVNSPPVTAIDAPGTITGADAYTITGTASDTGGNVGSVALAVTAGTVNVAPAAPADWTDAEDASDDGSFTKWSWGWTLPADGAYKIWYRATDKGSTAAKPIVETPKNIVVKVDRDPPTLVVTGPADNALLPAGTVVIYGTASDAGTGVKQVEVTADGVPLAITGTTSWSAAWEVVALGSHVLSVTASDYSDNMTTAPNCNITVDAVAPASAITSPASTVFIKGGQDCIIGGTASAAGTGVKAARVSVDGTWYDATDSSTNGIPYSKWSYTWTPPATGTYTLKSEATDNADRVEATAGKAGTTYKVDGDAPKATVSTPANTVASPGTATALAGTATDTGGSILKQVKVNITGPGAYSLTATPTMPTTTTWTYSWTPPAQAQDGTYTVTATATDNAGNSGTASSTLIINTAPVSTIDPQPACVGNANGTKTTYRIKLKATNAGDIVGKVYVAVTISTLTTAPAATAADWKLATLNTDGTWYYDWPVATAVEGSYKIWSKAADDTLPTARVETPKTTGLPVVKLDKTRPTASITRPATNSSVVKDVNLIIGGTASDTGSGLKSVRVSVDAGVHYYNAVITPGTPSTWTCTVNNVAQGVCNVRAEVTDNSLNAVVLPWTVTVDKTAPTSTITPPPSSIKTGTALVISVKAADTGGSGVNFVEMSVNGSTTWTKMTPGASGVWTYTWTAPATNGPCTISARATDKAGNVEVPLTKNAVTVLAQTETTLPVSSIKTPVNGAVLAGATITITGGANDWAGGSGVKKVEITIITAGDAPTPVVTAALAAGTTAWTYNWAPPASGAYLVTSKATDNAGNVEDLSQKTAITVNVSKTP